MRIVDRLIVDVDCGRGLTSAWDIFLVDQLREWIYCVYRERGLGIGGYALVFDRSWFVRRADGMAGAGYGNMSE